MLYPECPPNRRFSIENIIKSPYADDHRDDIDEPGKPKFNTPEYGYELPSMQDRATRKARNT